MFFATSKNRCKVIAIQVVKVFKSVNKNLKVGKK